MVYQLKTCRVECVGPSGNHIGYVTNQPDGYDHNRAHMSQTICDRPECRKRAEREVQEFTGEAAVFCFFKKPGPVQR